MRSFATTLTDSEIFSSLCIESSCLLAVDVSLCECASVWGVRVFQLCTRMQEKKGQKQWVICQSNRRANGAVNRLLCVARKMHVKLLHGSQTSVHGKRSVRWTTLLNRGSSELSSNQARRDADSPLCSQLRYRQHELLNAPLLLCSPRFFFFCRSLLAR